jgi:uncharacterized protein (TIGR02594 family)
MEDASKLEQEIKLLETKVASYCLEKGGQSAPDGYDAVRAKKYQDYGKLLKEPVYGSIAIFERSGGGHVGFVVGCKDGILQILGGNQSNMVCIKPYKKSKALAFVVPSGWKIPEGNKYK